MPDLTGFYVFYSLNVLHLLPKMQNRIFLELFENYQWKRITGAKDERLVDCFLRLPRHRHPGQDGLLLLQAWQVTFQKLVLELVSKKSLIKSMPPPPPWFAKGPHHGSSRRKTKNRLSISHSFCNRSIHCVNFSHCMLKNIFHIIISQSNPIQCNVSRNINFCSWSTQLFTLLSCVVSNHEACVSPELEN